MSLSQSLVDLEYSQKYYKLQFYNPYPYQKAFHELRSANGKLAKGRCLMAGNKIGKTLCGAAEIAMHMTGLYPKDWNGHRFTKAPHIVCSGKNSYRTRDLIQKELLGTDNKDMAEEVGTGWLPKHLILGTDRKPGIPGAVEKIHVRHVSGGKSTALLLGYEDGPDKVMGEGLDVGWCDEEPPQDIWSQYVRGTIATGGILILTFTPEYGLTQVVYRFRHECPDNYALIMAEWKDAPHITPERREELLKEILPHEREMREKGEPVVGESMVFPLSDDTIACDSFEIPSHWPQIIGIDFGGDHPFACVKMAFDPSGEKKKCFVIDCVKERRLTPTQEMAIITGMGGAKIPVAWPHDGNKLDKHSGKPVADLYRGENNQIKLLSQCFSNPPEAGKPEGSGGQGVEAGLKKMYWAMTEGRFKVFRHLTEWFKEKGMYHRKANTNGEVSVVRLNEDIMSATRYGYMSALTANDEFRFAEAINHKNDFFRKLNIDYKWVK